MCRPRFNRHYFSHGELVVLIMKSKKYILLLVTILASVLFPFGASAHQHATYHIGGNVYEFTIGSLNEPIAVDDKTGVELRVKILAGDSHQNEDEGMPATGLESTLKVELIAGTAKKTLDLSPAFNDPGVYRAVFIPTVQTAYTYRIFGTINNTPVDVSFSCNPAGHPRSANDTTKVEISKGVERTLLSGAFGCPTARADLGFPEPSVSTYELNQGVLGAQASAENALARTRFVNLIFGLAAAALVVAVYGAVRHSHCAVCAPEEKKR